MGSAQAAPFWRLALLYFVYFGVVGCTSPYWSLYLAELGFSAGDIGTLAAIPLLTKLVAPNLWSWISDVSGRRLFVLRLGAVGACLSFALVAQATAFFPLLFFLAIYSIAWNAILPQIEAVTLTYLGTRADRYSLIRSWGSVGFIVLVLALGVAFERISVAYLPLVILGLLLAIVLCAGVLPDHENLSVRSRPGDFLRLLGRPVFIAFFGVLFLVQASHGAYYVFYSLYLELHGYSKWLIGCLWTAGVLSEIVIFIFCPRLLASFSPFLLLAVSLAATALRWLLIAIYPNTLWVVIAAQLLHALSFGVIHAVAVDFLRREFSPAIQAQGQALYSAISYGAGAALGAFLSGKLWEYSPAYVFLFASLLAGSALLTAVVFLRHRL